MLRNKEFGSVSFALYVQELNIEWYDKKKSKKLRFKHAQALFLYFLLVYTSPHALIVWLHDMQRVQDMTEGCKMQGCEYEVHKIH